MKRVPNGRYTKEFRAEAGRRLSFPAASKILEEPMMTYEYFMKLADQFRSPHLWKKEESCWKLKHQVRSIK